MLFRSLNRPEVRNALNGQVIADLHDCARNVRTMDGVRVVVLSGHGPSFCAGADAAWMAQAIHQSDDENRQEAERVGAMLTALDTLPMPVVGRIHGAALGGGAGLVAVCDVVVAADDTIFGFTEVALGLIPAMVAPFALSKIGLSAARDSFLTGRRFSAERARSMGLVHDVVPLADLDTAVAAITRACLEAAPGAVAAAKALLRQIAVAPQAEALRLGASAIAARRTSAEGQEGLRAFLEKRRPSWRP